MIPNLNYDASQDVPQHKLDVQIMVLICKDCKISTEHSAIRSKNEILDKADLIYRMDWDCVDARIHRLTRPMKLNYGVTQAKHKTLNLPQLNFL